MKIIEENRDVPLPCMITREETIKPRLSHLCCSSYSFQGFPVHHGPPVPLYRHDFTKVLVHQGVTLLFKGAKANANFQEEICAEPGPSRGHLRPGQTWSNGQFCIRGHGHC